MLWFDGRVMKMLCSWVRNTWRLNGNTLRNWPSRNSMQKVMKRINSSDNNVICKRKNKVPIVTYMRYESKTSNWVSQQEPRVVMNYLGGIHCHIQEQWEPLNVIIIDEASKKALCSKFGVKRGQKTIEKRHTKRNARKLQP